MNTLTTTVSPLSTSSRRAMPEDLESLTNLFDSYRQFYGKPSSIEQSRQFIAERLQKQDSILLVEQSHLGELLGFCQLYPSFSPIQCARSFILNDLFVSEEARNCGAGQSLLRAARAQAMALGATSLTLETSVNNRHAQRLYESFGFVRSSDFCAYAMNV